MERRESQKLVVAKGEYLRRLGGKVALTSAGTLLLVTGLIGACLSFVAVVFIVLMWLCNWSSERGNGVPLVIGSLVFLIVAGIASCYAAKVSGCLLLRAGRVQTGVPLTRYSEPHLSAEQVLVRGSQPNPQGLETELLRGSIPAHATPDDELLRAAGAEPGQQNRAGIGRITLSSNI